MWVACGLMDVVDDEVDSTPIVSTGAATTATTPASSAVPKTSTEGVVILDAQSRRALLGRTCVGTDKGDKVAMGMSRSVGQGEGSG